MPVRAPRTPKYRRHKPSGQAVVTLNGQDHYLGRHGSPESQAEYKRLVAGWLSGTLTQDPCVDELILAYIKYVDGYYTTGNEPTNIRCALRPLRRLHGQTRATAFGPLALKAVRQSIVEDDICRNEVNKRVRHIVRMFKWAVENEMVEPSVYQALKTVPGLKKGRSTARESVPVRPVPDAHVDAIRPHVAHQVWAMVELQRLTGMRSGEVTIMRGVDIDWSGEIWVYTPSKHKTQHHGKERKVPLGPRARAILIPFLRDGYLFSPKDVMEEHYAARRRDRKTPMTPSQRARVQVAKRKRQPGDHYTTASYQRAVAAACKRADVPHWHPHKLRHSAATRFRKEFGIDAARVVLGHSSAAVTEVYAEADHEKARSVMGEIG
jgi:integrase